ncbi:heavy metal translocating P-type ATPase [Heyndrickxia acidicola]|uniref:Copper-exporting P-type ATPase n=1 Tax=Heyndrickxia acidicola TaxID=209389 RepID=A0ABU6MCI5_9BACI|nr:heavy metal translocating P-type ATPase [Heyndrickxia acidicola]MED1202366.1 heavy metal translocating P-type ATPase [Heyndrickxia acidicola]
MSVKEKEVQIQIGGMTCAACANRIEKGLNKVEGVNEANVNFALENAKIKFNPEVTNVGEFQVKVKNLGYNVELDKSDFMITGMTCAACANRIEKGLNKLNGVTKANVNLALENATVEYNSSEISTADIIKKVQSLGYDASLKDENSGDKAVDHKEKEIKKQRNKFIFSAVLSLPLLWVMVSHFSITSFIYVPNLLMNPWVQLVLATPVQFFIGKQFYIGAYKALKNKSANMDVLVALGTTAAYFYSLYLTILSIGSQGSTELYFETSSILITLILLGKLFEAKAKGRSSEAIKKLMGLQPKTALVEREGVELEIPLDQVGINDIVLVKPGNKIPVDGVVVEGNSAVDESMITGESIPVDKSIGDNAIGATINKNGYLKIRAKKVGKETALAQIIKIVEDAQGSKAPIQRLADQISGVFVPIVVGIAALTFLTWFIWVNPGDFPSALEKFIAVLVIACPCALGLATPTSIMAGSGRAAEIGVLFKGGEHLEKTHDIDTIVLDKTGTVTNGEPILTDVVVKDGFNENLLFQLIASAERQSEHPVAQAIVQGVTEKGTVFSQVESFENVPGYGIQATVNGYSLLIGTQKLMNQHKVEFTSVLDTVNLLESNGKTVMLVAVNQEYAGVIAVADTVKENSKDAINRLKNMGLEVFMITGDNKRTASYISEQVEIDHVIAEVLPSGKAEEVKKLQQRGRKVAMVGDGINDAPALATADVGMAIGTGTDVAMEAADITLIRGDLNSIADAIFMSKKTIHNIKQNLFWALAYNAIGIPIAAYGFLAPWLAGAAMAFSSVSVVLNALRLQKVKL